MSSVIQISGEDAFPLISGGKSSSGLSLRRVFRAWMRLSRLQKSIIYAIMTIIMFVLIYYHLEAINAIAESDSDMEDTPDDDFLEDSQHKEWKGRNKVEIVHNAINKPVDESQNRAEEEKNLDSLDNDFGDDNDNGSKDNENIHDQDDQGNHAGEEHDESGEEALDGRINFMGPQNDRQKAVVEATKHAWNGYKKYAWGHDHLKPLSRTSHNWFGLGLTIVDSLDTLYMMNLKDEFKEARNWIADNLSFNVNKDVNFFETTIRVLGGLLGAFHLTGDQMLVEKAKDLGDRLLGAFSSPSGIPYSDVNLKSNRGHAPKWSLDSSTSEVSTIQLEFRDLSRITGVSAYEEKAEAVSLKIHDMPKPDGLVPIFINANTGKFRMQSTITMGARGDSYYEYLLKQWLQTGKTQDYLKDDFIEAMEGVSKKLAKRTKPNNLLFIGELLSGGKTFKPKMDELACFLPGTLALGVHNGLPKSHMDLAQELAYTCFLTFARQPTFLSAEINYFNTDSGTSTDFYVKPNDSHYLLRPETIEGLWYLYYFTGNKTYQDWGWKIFQGIEKYTKVKDGYTTIGNVKNALDVRPKDMMESFLLGETFKYLYLLFADNHEINLDKWVLNTEGHPMPVYRD